MASQPFGIVPPVPPASSPSGSPFVQPPVAPAPACERCRWLALLTAWAEEGRTHWWWPLVGALVGVVMGAVGGLAHRSPWLLLPMAAAGVALFSVRWSTDSRCPRCRSRCPSCGGQGECPDMARRARRRNRLAGVLMGALAGLLLTGAIFVLQLFLLIGFWQSETDWWMVAIAVAAPFVGAFIGYHAGASGRTRGDDPLTTAARHLRCTSCGKDWDTADYAPAPVELPRRT